jgi:ABC-type Fe3+ transport system substrate-binding protein
MLLRLIKSEVQGLDKRVLIGIAAIVVIGIGFIAFQNMSTPDVPDDGDNGVVSPTTGTISGVVEDDQGDPVSGATVTVDGKTVTTGSDGSYTFNVEAGTYTVEVEKPDYDSDSSSVTVAAGGSKTADLVLTSSEEPPAAVSDKIRILTRHGSDIYINARTKFLTSDIAAEYGITDKSMIEFVPISSSLWVDTIINSENLAGKEIDIAWGGGPVVFDLVHEAELLAPLTDPDLVALMDTLPDEISGVASKRYQDGDVYWVGSAISSFGFTINTDYLEQEGLPEPATWKDLASEIYAVTLPNPSIGTADATLSTSNTRIFEIILQNYGWVEGWETLTLLGANSRIYDKSESVRDGAITGQIGAGTTIDFYGYTAQLQNPDFCKYVLPEDGTAVNADPVALISTSENKDMAQAFIRWLLTPEGQSILLADTINRMPMNPAVFDTEIGLARSDLKTQYEITQEAFIIGFSDEEALSYEQSMMYFFHSTLVRAQLQLVDTWLEMTYAFEQGEITRTQLDELINDLTNPLEFTFVDPLTGSDQTFTVEYAQSISSKFQSDAEFKSNIIDAWRIAAIDRYEAVMDSLNSMK